MRTLARALALLALATLAAPLGAQTLPSGSITGITGGDPVQVTNDLNLPTGCDATPSLNWGDQDSGICEKTDDNMYFRIAGTERWVFNSFAQFLAINNNGALVDGAASTSTKATLVPNRASATTGLGGISGELSLITGGVEAVNIDASQNVQFRGSYAGGNAVAGPRLQNETSTATNPTLLPHKLANTGLGGVSGTLDLITGGVSGLHVDASQGVTLSNILSITPKASAPGTCSIGDFYVDTSGAACACSASNTWSNMHATGTCV